MVRLDHGWVAVACTLLLVVAMAGSAAASGAARASAVESAGPAAGGSLAADAGGTNLTQSDGDIVQTQRYSLTPDQPGSVQVRLSYDMPDQVRSLEVQFLTEATVTDTDGFDRVDGSTYEWDESTSGPSITLTYNPNETTSRTGPEAAAGRYLLADTGEWALLRQFRTTVEYSYTGSEPGFERRARTTGPGAVGDRMVYLGEVSTTERTANGQTFRLVVPEAAALNESPEAILDSLTSASESLRIGDHDEEVLVIAAPTGQVEWAVRGLATGDSDVWVRDFERLDEPANVWVHEYVHTRQAFRTSAETKWLTEATAQYYAAQLTLEQERISFDEFRRELARGERATYDDVVLADPTTWTDNANYVKGALAAGRLDLQLRRATNQSGTLEGVIRELNARELNTEESPVTQTAFLEAVAATGGAESRTRATELTETSESLSMWGQSTQTRYFGVLPAQVEYALPTGPDGYRASGPSRNDTVSSTPVRLATGERLTVDTAVSNTGGEAGTYNATLTVDGRVVASSTGQIDAGSERTVPLAHTFERAGEYTVGVGEETVTVVVEPPAEPTVSNVSVDSDRVRVGDGVLVTATVRNDAAVPANGTVAFTRDGEAVIERAVTLAPGASTEVSAELALPTAGERRVGAGSATVTVTVVAPTGTATVGGPAGTSGDSGPAGTSGDSGPAGTSGDSGPGFTATAAVLAALLALLARRR